MRIVSRCGVCKSTDIVLYPQHGDACYCNKCKRESYVEEHMVESPYERTRRQVYSTGNRWAIENFEATHN